MTECPPIALMCVGNPLYTPLKLSWPSKLKSGHSPFRPRWPACLRVDAKKLMVVGERGAILGGSKIGEELGSSTPNLLTWQPTGLGSNLRLQYNSKPPGESTSASKLLPLSLNFSSDSKFYCSARFVRPSSDSRFVLRFHHSYPFPLPLRVGLPSLRYHSHTRRRRIPPCRR